MPASRPALRRFIDAFRDATSHPLALWLSTELAAESGGIAPDPWPDLVGDLEAEGSRAIGAVECGADHGFERPAHPGETEPSAWLLMSACPRCEAAL